MHSSLCILPSLLQVLPFRAYLSLSIWCRRVYDTASISDKMKKKHFCPNLSEDLREVLVLLWPIK